MIFASVRCNDSRMTISRDLAVANPDPAFLPVLALATTERKGYTDIRDDAALVAWARAGIAAEGVDAAHIGIASGAMDAIERALTAWDAAGTTIALEDPAYPPYAKLAEALGIRVVRMAIDERGITPEALRDALQANVSAIVVVPRAHNPTGASFDAARAALLRHILADAPHVGVIEDDYLALVAGAALHTLCVGRERFLHVRSLAKTLGPDIRVATYAADATTLARIVARQHLGYGWVSTLLQETARSIVVAPATALLLRTAIAAYDERRTTFLAACASAGIHAVGGAGFTAWVAVADEDAAVRAARADGFAIDGGARYRAFAAPGVRVTTTTITAAESRRLARALAP